MVQAYSPEKLHFFSGGYACIPFDLPPTGPRELCPAFQGHSKSSELTDQSVTHDFLYISDQWYILGAVFSDFATIRKIFHAAPRGYAAQRKLLSISPHAAPCKLCFPASITAGAAGLYM